MQRIREAPGDTKKYVVPDKISHLVVKADVKTGDDEFEVVYDLLHASPLENSRYAVDFSAEDKKTGLRQQGTLIWAPADDDAGILLGFDDFFPDSWENHFDLLDRYGAKVTFFVQGEFKGEGRRFCTEAQKRGHDIGYHSLNHTDLRKASREIFFRETLTAAEAFRAAGIPLSSFAYPFGFWEPWMNELLFPAFTILRGYGVTFRLYNRETLGSGYISSLAIDNTVLKDDPYFEVYLGLLLRAVKFIGGDSIAPLTTHEISDTAQWGIKPRRLEYVLKTARDLKLKFYRYGDVVRQ